MRYALCTFLLSTLMIAASPAWSCSDAPNICFQKRDEAHIEHQRMMAQSQGNDDGGGDIYGMVTNTTPDPMTRHLEASIAQLSAEVRRSAEAVARGEVSPAPAQTVTAFNYTVPTGGAGALALSVPVLTGLTSNMWHDGIHARNTLVQCVNKYKG